MRKIPTIFKRDQETHRVYDETVEGCEWVLAGEGVATRKWDGTCVLLRRDGMAVKAFARREVKPGKEPPANWVEVDHDEVTGKRMGWEPAEQSSFAPFIAEAIKGHEEPGTYELIGPKINGNPEGVPHHELRRHGDTTVPEWAGRDFDAIRSAVTRMSWEGVVFHHPDGRMAKIKRKDFS